MLKLSHNLINYSKFEQAHQASNVMERPRCKSCNKCLRPPLIIILLVMDLDIFAVFGIHVFHFVLEEK
jgi:hypothetical protein